MWREEPESVKKQWKDKAENVKRQHLRDHPDYQYQPRKPHEKKRRMTKRKARALAAQQATPSSSTSTPTTTQNPVGASSTFSPAPSTTGPFSSITSPSQIVDLANLGDPALNFSANGDLGSFTLDTFEQGQLDLFSNLLDEHNNDFDLPPTSTRAPGACAVLPTPINHAMADGSGGASLLDPSLTANDMAMAESDLTNFESSLEDMLARELEGMEQDGGRAVAEDQGFQYNDFESQRFTEFLEQMPEHMWGMEFVN